MKTVLKVLGILLILAGIGAFLTASVGYSSAKQGPKNIAAPAGMTIEVPENDPERLKIEQKAENFLNASLGLGGAGLVLLIAGCVLPKKQQKYSESNQSNDQLDHAEECKKKQKHSESNQSNDQLDHAEECKKQ